MSIREQFDNLRDKKKKTKQTLVFELSVGYLLNIDTQCSWTHNAHILLVIIYIHLKSSRPKINQSNMTVENFSYTETALCGVGEGEALEKSGD